MITILLFILVVILIFIQRIDIEELQARIERLEAERRSENERNGLH